MVEISLSSYNTQESSGVFTPLSSTMLSQEADFHFKWLCEQLGGDLSDFDPTLKPLVIVQGRGYGNMTYYARDLSRIFPTDPAAIGIPPEIDLHMAKVPFWQLMRLPFNFCKVYVEMVHFHHVELGELVEKIRRNYQALHDLKADPLPLIWPLFAPEFVEQCSRIGCQRILSAMMVMMLDNILRKQKPELLSLFAGSNTTSSLIGRQIWRLCGLAESCGPEVVQLLHQGVTDLDIYARIPEAAPLMQELQSFLQEYGHRGFEHELDFESDRLIDHQDLVLLAIASQFGLRETPVERAHVAQELGRQALLEMRPMERAIWEKVLVWGGQLIAVREDFKSNLALSQALFGLMARRLSCCFYPDDPDDMFFFYTWDEFLAFGRSQGKQRISLETISERRAEWKLNLRLPSPPELIWYDMETGKWRPGLEVEPFAKDSCGPRLKGIPVSGGRGVVEGVALVKNNPLEAAAALLEFQGPAILVTRLTDPAWSSLFLRLTGVITELGGAISHAAIIARENGLPAVVGVADATRLIHDGQWLRLDGMLGTVDLLD